jgi:UDP-N-acetylmuramate--alanine ligase
MGGMSSELEVSFNSGRTICDHLDTSRFDVIPIYQSPSGKLYILPWRFLHRGKTTDFEHRLENEAESIKWGTLKNKIDFAYLAMHGPYGEDGTIQGFLSILGIPYLGSGVLAGALGMDKIVQKDILAAHNINVPKGFSLSTTQINNLSSSSIASTAKTNNLEYPCVVKPYKAGSSLGVSVVFEQNKLLEAIKKAAIVNKKVEPVVIEQHIKGMEFTCILITDYKTGKFRPLPPTEIVFEKGTHLYEYDQKYMPGRALKITPARCSDNDIKHIKKISIKVTKKLGFTNLSRIDGILKKDGDIYIFDANSHSGMTPTSFIFEQAAAENISHTELINHFIDTEIYLGNIGSTANKKMSLSLMKKNTVKRKKIAVLFGGPSKEKEVSLDSGRNVIYKLSPNKYEAIPVFADKKMNLYRIDKHLLVHNTTKQIQMSLDPKTKIEWDDLTTIADFVFLGFHGRPGEDGAVQGALEILGIPYNGSGVLTSALCTDKYKANHLLKSKSFETPKEHLITKETWDLEKDKLVAEIETKTGFPVIVKPNDDGCSVLVQKAQNQADLTSFIKNIFKDGRESVLVEEFIKGMELTVGVLGNEKPTAFPPSHSVASNEILSMEEKFLPGAGENQTPAPLTQKTTQLVQKTIESAYKAIGCSGYARIDCFYQTKEQSPTKKERVVILEINSLPALTPATCLFHQAAEVGMRPMEFMDKIIELGFEKHKNSELETNKKTETKNKNIKNLIIKKRPEEITSSV